MNTLRIGIVGFDITPRIHPEFGAWGTTPSMTEIHLPLLSRCLVLEQDGLLVVWYGSDLVGDSPLKSDYLRDEVASALDMKRDQILWGTNQNHSCGATPWSQFTGDVTANLSRRNPDFAASEEKRILRAFVGAAQQARDRLQPATVWAGHGYCDSVSFNTRHLMPNGRIKFCRRWEEGIHSSRPIDPTINLVRFDDAGGRPIAAILNFCMHPATMINDRMISSDWVGPARQCVEEALDGAPVLFCQGFCSDVNCYHMFGTPAQSERTGARLGQAAVEALKTLIPARGVPLALLQRTIDLDCQPIPKSEQFESEIGEMMDFIENLKDNPDSLWCCGMNLADQLTPETKVRIIESKIDYRRVGIRLLKEGRVVPRSLPLTLGVLRIGDIAVVLSPGENYVTTGLSIRARSPFVHTLIGGDVNGLFGNIFTDEEIIGGGHINDSYFEIMALDGFRLPPAMGTVHKVIETCVELLKHVQESPGFLGLMSTGAPKPLEY